YTGTSSPYDAYKITFGTNATNPSESSSSRIIGVAEMSSRNIGTGSINFLNCNIASGVDNIGNVTIKRKTGTCGIIEKNGNQSIACHWQITVGSQPTNGRNVTYSWLSILDNGKNFSSSNLAEFWVSENGTEWTKKGDGFDVSGSNPRTMTVNTTNFSYWVASSQDAPMPVELLSFNYKIKIKDVTLKWITASEENNLGFEIQRNPIENNTWEKIGFIEGKGTTKLPTIYEFTDKSTNFGKYRYRLKQIDYNGNYQYFTLNSIVEIKLPEKFELSQNYPNPFNNYTIINLICPSEEKVELKVFDISGREIITILNNTLKPGSYNFKINTEYLTSGIYFYRLIAGSTIITRSMVLIK
ncbi:MAG: T9SS type A sorting domain-containing protein, partial [Ignavibacteria bacterium]|nr:T9SS type A sorting domain-containing protein [Ignavibacteria bacterium]